VRISIKKLALSGLLGAVAVVLGALQIGFIPVPTPAGRATILHIPAILGGIVAGPVVGLLVGFIFGLFSWLTAVVPIFADPLVAVFPRLFIGVAAYYTVKVLGKGTVGVAVAGAVGTAANTILVLGMAVIRGYLPVKAAGLVAITHGPPEIIVAVIITVAVSAAIKRVGVWEDI